MIFRNKSLKNFLIILIYLKLSFFSFYAYSQTNIDSISGRFQQLSKQLADLEKFVYGKEKNSNTSLSSGQQNRINALENAVKELRGIIEVELPFLKEKVESINLKINQIDNKEGINQATGSNVSSQLNQDLLLLNDKIRLIDSRFNSTVDLIGKSEIRIMRLESLFKSSSLSENQNTINSIENNISSVGEGANKIPNSNPLSQTGNVEVIKGQNETIGLLSLDNNSESNILETVLPDAPPEEQFKFSLELALKRKYDEAEIALKEFMETHPTHERNKDAHYWYGGVLFKQKKYEDSAFSDIDFNDKYPNEPRTVDTTLRIAQAMSYVAPPEQACTVFENSLNFIVDPPERFVRKINELKADKACD